MRFFAEPALGLKKNIQKIKDDDKELSHVILMQIMVRIKCCQAEINCPTERYALRKLELKFQAEFEDDRLWIADRKNFTAAEKINYIISDWKRDSIHVAPHKTKVIKEILAPSLCGHFFSCCCNYKSPLAQLIDDLLKASWCVRIPQPLVVPP